MSGFRLAASNIAWDKADDDAVLEQMRMLGYQGLEIAPTRAIGTDPYEHLDKARTFRHKISTQYGLTICSLQSIWYGRTECIFNEDDRPQLLDYTKAAIDFATVVGAHNLVFGCPKNRRMPASAHTEDAHSFFMATGASADPAGVTLALEANPIIYGTNFLNTTSEVFDFLRSLPNAKGLSINLDFGAIIENREPLDGLAPYLPYVSHVHISEPHLAPILERPEHGELCSMLEQLEYQGFVSLEMAQCDSDTLSWCLQYIAEVFA